MNMDVRQPAAASIQDTEFRELIDDTGPRFVQVMENIVACTESRLKIPTVQSSMVPTELDQQRVVLKCESGICMLSQIVIQ